MNKKKQTRKTIRKQRENQKSRLNEGMMNEKVWKRNEKTGEWEEKYKKEREKRERYEKEMKEKKWKKKYVWKNLEE